ncbi:helix-turn-helix domain-containing protein [Rhodohalobacter sp. 8-1]|uniref:helix-turn-helix domain-containing protein n=1 Tax=Rhodohalobacter sp. 8-1 TaxID=3131972 RepID=UPI00403F7668
MKHSITIHFDSDLLQNFEQVIKDTVKAQLPKLWDSFQKNWLSTEEVMEMMNVSRRTVQNYRDDGKISYTQDGRKILYPRESIEKFLRDNMIKAYQ